MMRKLVTYFNTIQKYSRVVQKLQFLNNFLIKTAVLQVVDRKTANKLRAWVLGRVTTYKLPMAFF